MFEVAPSSRAYPLQSSPFFYHLFVYGFLAAAGLIFSWLPRPHKIEGDIQRAVLEHPWNFQMILCICSETINMFRSCILECFHSPVCLITTLPFLMIENTPPFIMILVALWKNSDALLVEHDKDEFFLFKEDTKIQTFHGYWDPQSGHVDEPEPCPTDNSYRQSVSFSYANYRPPHCYLLPEMRLHRKNRKG